MNPTAFDRNHPNLGPLLAEDQRVRTLIAKCPSPQILTISATGAPSLSFTAGHASLQILGGTAAVPEPKAFLLVLLGTTALLAW